jgi:hypothetical protein
VQINYHSTNGTGSLLVRLGSTVHFRAFVIQARLATKDGFIIGHLRAGQFLPSAAWNATGVQIQNCPPVFDNSITNTNYEEKFLMEANWTSNVNLGPVQFLSVICSSKLMSSSIYQSYF